jgi:hypothetical protein
MKSWHQHHLLRIAEYGSRMAELAAQPREFAPLLF